MIGLNPVSDGFKILSMTFLLTFCGGRCFLSVKYLLKKFVANILKYEFCKMHLRPVEHFFPPFFSRSVLTSHKIHTLAGWEGSLGTCSS